MLSSKSFLNLVRTSCSRMSSSFAPKPADRTAQHTTSIWVEFTTLAAETKAVNLGQGFPDSPAPKFVTDILEDLSKHPELTAAHQYTRGYGHPMLVDILAKMYSHFYNVQVDPMNEVLVTVGAYLSLYYAFLGWVNKGDEVLIIEPAYDCYYPQVKFAGGVPVPVVMNLQKGATSASQFTIDFADMESKINEKTKMLVINNPHNPTGKLFSRQELEKLAELAKKHNLIVIADEVYEFHVWDKNDMIRFASLPGMYERTISIGSAGKAFSVTGWKLGWAVGPKQLLEPLKAIHQNCVFTCSTPTQMAIAEAFRLDWPKFLNDPKNSYLATGLSGELRDKRDKLAKMLEEGNFRPIIPDAGYFMLADYSHLKEELNLAKEKDPDDFVFSRWLCREKKLAVIPPSAFYSDRENKDKNSNMVRLCYFKKNETLDAAEVILKKLGKE
uniref:Aminotran_1_2 domain-containing protein n=1 Tax=Caenorhabditis tropicalis TaxID=1561998 RepID=A0A1I7T9U7_9PELO